MTIAILDARTTEYVLVAAGADLIGTYVAQAIVAGTTAQAVLDAILAAGLAEGVFPSLAEGEGATTDGQYFWVGSGGTVTLYVNDSGTGDEIAELATVASFAASDGATKVGFLQSGTDSRAQDVAEKLFEIRSILDKEGGFADGSTSNVAAFEAAVADGGAWRVPKQAQPYVWDAQFDVSDTIFIMDAGVEILADFSAAGTLDYIVNARDNVAFYCAGKWSVSSAVHDQLRYAIIIPGSDNVTVDGLETVNLLAVRSRSSVTPINSEEAWSSVVTSGGSANIATNIHISGGGSRFNTPCTGTLTPAAHYIAYTFIWSITGARYYGCPGAVQFWGGNANPANDGALANERKCRYGVIAGCYSDTAISGIWGSMGRDIDINDSTAIENEDVSLDGEGCVDVRFNNCVGRDGARGAGAAFFLNRGLEYNNCRLTASDAANDAFQISNPSQSTENHSITLRGCTFECTDTAPSRIIAAAVKYLNIIDPVFVNVVCTVDAANNHVTNIVNPSVTLPNAGGMPSSTFTANATSNELTHSDALRLQYIQRVRFTTTGTLPAPLTTGTDYFVTPLTATTCKVSTSVANAVDTSPVYVDISDTGTGTHTMTVALSAISAGGNNSVDGIAGRCTISNPKIFSEETQPAGSVGIYVAQYDFNAAPVTIISDGNISNMPIDMQMMWGGENAGFSGRFLLHDNISGNNIVFFQDNAGAAGGFYYWNNRNPSNALFNRASHIADPTGGVTVDAEARTAINAILDILESSNAGLMAP